jgi:SAM-dependent methyltransferase
MTPLQNKLGSEPAPPVETVDRCPLCGSGETEFRFETYDRFYHLPGKFALVKCRGCTLQRLSPRPRIAELGYYYPAGEYYSYHSPPELKERGKLAQFREDIRQTVLQERFGYPSTGGKKFSGIFRAIIGKLFYLSGSYGYGERFPKFVAGGKALDIGCGHAFYLSLLKGQGWNVAGVDLSAEAAETAKRVYGIDVFAGNVEDAGFAEESFDYIYMSHSIEHLPDPVSTLAYAARLLKPSGTIYIEAPNGEAYNFDRMKTFWRNLDSPRHLYHFSPETIRMALVKAGFRPTRIKAVYQDHYAWYDTYRVEDATGELLADRPQLRASSYPAYIASSIAARVISRLFFNKGDFLYCWAEKQIRIDLS